MLREFILGVLVFAMVCCVVMLGIIGYIHLGPFVVSQKEYSEGKLVGVISGERIDGNFVLVHYRFEAGKGERVSLPAYVQDGQDGVKFGTYPTDFGSMEIVTMQQQHQNQITLRMASKERGLDLDAETRQKATKLLQIGRKRFVAAGGIPPI